jgi:flagellar M-ring protein FliF
MPEVRTMDMAGFGSAFRHLSMQQRVVAGLAVLAAVAAFWGILRMATEPGMALLYAGLDAAAAGDVIQSLEQQGAIHEVRGGAIYVDSTQRDALRLTLAAEGKPATGSAGYELLDSLSGFGTTSQMFDAAYWRAKEGELARTIMASPLVRSARVHISASGSRPFVRAAAPSASVSIIPMGAGIPPEQAAAIRYLVSSAVAGLDPADVTVVDGRAGRIVAGEGDTSSRSGDERAEELRRRAERLLEARVGPGNALVEVAIETVTESEQIVERRLDPDSRVLISTEVEERATASSNTQPGNVTVASNLPDGDAGGSGQQSTSDDSETRERSNFDVSETTREVVRMPGGVQRITVAVLVNEAAATGDGTAAPRSQEELDALKDLVGSAVGLNEARGDVITVRAMPFTLPDLAEDGSVGLLAQLLAGLDLMRLLQLAALAIVTLVLGLFVVRPILLRPPPRATDFPRIADARDVTDAALLPAQPVPALPVPAGARADAAQRLVRAMETRQSDAAAVLKNWIRASEGGA